MIEPKISDVAYVKATNKTVEEQIKEHYNSFGNSISAMERKKGMRDILDILDMKIEGIND